MAVDLSIPDSGYRADLYYWLASCCEAAYEATVEQRTALLNAPGPCTWGHVPRDRDILPQLLWADYGDWLVIALAGSESPAQWVGNLFGLEPRHVAGVPGSVHAFFGFAGGIIEQQMLRRLPPGIGTRRVIITGHSLGGAVAQILAHRWHARHPGKVYAVVTFGSPKVGLRSYTGNAQWIVHRVNGTDDPVPFLPPGVGIFKILPANVVVNLIAGYVHDGGASHLDYTGRRRQSVLPYEFFHDDPAINPLHNRYLEAVKIGHFVSEYVVRTRARLPARVGAEESNFERFSDVDFVSRELFGPEDWDARFRAPQVAAGDLHAVYLQGQRARAAMGQGRLTGPALFRSAG